MYTIQDIKELRERTGAGMLDSKNALEESKGDINAAIDYLREKGMATAAKREGRIAAEGLTKFVTKDNKAVIIEVNSETDFVAKNDEFVKFVDMLANELLNSDVTTMEDALELEIDGVKVSDLVINLTSKIGEKISFRRLEVINKEDTQVFGTYSHMGGNIGVVAILEGANDEVAKDVAMHVAAMNPLYLDKDLVPTDVIEHEKEIIKEQAINEGKPEHIAEKMVAGRINKYYEENTLLKQAFFKDDSKSIEEYVSENDAKVVSYVRYKVGEGIEKKEEDFASEVMSQIKG